MVTPRLNPIGHRTAGIRKVISLSELTNDQNQLQVFDVLEQWFSPLWSTFGTRRQVAATTCARVTKPHWQDRELFRIVECLGGNSQPISQAIPAGIGEGDSGLMDPSPWSLPGDQNSGFGMNLKHRSRTEREVLHTNRAVPDFLKQLWEWDHGSNSALKVSGLLVKTARKVRAFRR
jgi:hypothetical protein